MAFLLAAAAFLGQARVGFDPADEGFLWMGVVRTAHGEVPLRDFYSYDPGRYLWGAAWACLLGDGILALRVSNQIFAAGGLFCGLLVARRVTERRTLLVLIGALLLVWLFPRHKLFEPAIAMAAVYAALRLIEGPSRRHHFLAGVVTGLAALFGKNHGLYCGLAFLLLIALLQWRGRGAREGVTPAHGSAPGPPGAALAVWVAGVAVGALPLVLMMACAPGFAASYVDSFLFFLRLGRTNNPLPIPWPWRGSVVGIQPFDAANRLALGLSFVMLPAFYAVAAVLVWKTAAPELDRRKVVIAAFVVGFFYLHHAFSRADAPHLGQSIHPALLGLCALPAALRPSRRRPAVVGITLLLAVVTLLVAVPESPLYKALAAAYRNEPYVPRVLAGDRLVLPPELAGTLAGLAEVVEARVPTGAPMLILPTTPGLYPALGRRARVWDTFLVWPADIGSDERLVRESERAGIGWALAGDHDVDGSGDFRFRSTHPILCAYLRDSFESVPDPRLPPHYELLRRR